MDIPSKYPRFLPSGEAGVLIEFSDQIAPEINARVRLMADRVRNLPFVIDLIPAFSSLLIQFDPLKITFDELKVQLEKLEKALPNTSSTQEKVIHEIPVLYDGEDLPFVARNSSLSEEEVIRLHSSEDYLIYMLGFLPGFAYLGGLDEKLHCPRLTSPREKIPAGSVGIGGKQTGIYPMASPGGWRLIGRTPLSPYDPHREPQFLYSMGECIRFVPITEEQYQKLEQEELEKKKTASHSDGTGSSSTSAHGTVTVLSKGLYMTIQDKGRFGYQAQGFSVSGCMDLSSYQEANRLAGNMPGAAVIEMLYMGGSFRFDSDTKLALTGADMQPKINGTSIPMHQCISVHKGDTLTLGAAVSGRYGYLAIQGGLDVPIVMGSRSTNVKCGIGGWEGRALNAGDVLPLGAPIYPKCSFFDRIRVLFSRKKTDSSSVLSAESSSASDPLIIRVLGGSQQERFKGHGLTTLFSETYTVSPQSDRMGYRLDGPSIEAPDGVDIVSDGTVFGSIQVPSSGKPIILLADRQTTGGYAKIGTVIAADLPKLVQCMPGRKLRFVPCSMEEAMEAYRRLYS